MRIRFVRGEEAGSKHNGFRSERQGRDNPARIRDTSGYGDRKRRYRIHDSRRQHHRGDLTFHVTTSLSPLCNYEIHSGSRCATGTFHRTNLQDDLAAGCVYPLDIS